MKWSPLFIILGIVQIIILTLVGLYFYRLAHSPAKLPMPQSENVQLSQ